MYAVRLIVVFLLIVAVVFAYSPVSREQVKENWQIIRPGVVEIMDSVYATVRTLIAGDGRDDRIHDNPIAPGVDFERVVTMSNGLFS
jgi:hypothetical protein